jgi:translation elongation factor EF-1beta
MTESQTSINIGNLSQVVFRIRPWDYDMEIGTLIVAVLGLNLEGLTWGANTTENVGYGIRDFIVTAVLDETLISIDDVIDRLTEFDDIISRVDVPLWNKVQ